MKKGIVPKGPPTKKTVAKALIKLVIQAESLTKLKDLSRIAYGLRKYFDGEKYALGMNIYEWIGLLIDTPDMGEDFGAKLKLTYPELFPKERAPLLKYDHRQPSTDH